MLCPASSQMMVSRLNRLLIDHWPLTGLSCTYTVCLCIVFFLAFCDGSSRSRSSSRLLFDDTLLLCSWEESWGWVGFLLSNTTQIKQFNGSRWREGREGEIKSLMKWDSNTPQQRPLPWSRFLVLCLFSCLVDSSQQNPVLFFSFPSLLTPLFLQFVAVIFIFIIHLPSPLLKALSFTLSHSSFFSFSSNRSRRRHLLLAFVCPPFIPSLPW